jgi:hypothetical protein
MSHLNPPLSKKKPALILDGKYFVVDSAGNEVVDQVGNFVVIERQSTALYKKRAPLTV